jgi:hypothetical protein
MTKPKKTYLESTRRWKALNKDRVSAQRKLYREQNKDKQQVYNKQHYDNHPEKYRMKSANQRATRLRRCVLWDAELTAFVLQEASALCKLRQETTKVLWEIDHIIPLCGANVSGLHVWNNLRVITQEENRRKSNYFPRGECKE